MTLLVGRQEGHLACKKTEWWGAGVVICLERRADLHMAQLIPLPLTVFCFSKIQTGFTFLVPAHPGGPGQRAVKRACVCSASSTQMRTCHCPHLLLSDVLRHCCCWAPGASHCRWISAAGTALSSKPPYAPAAVE